MAKSRPARALSVVLSRAPAGLKAPAVRVEVHIGSGLPAFVLVGLPQAVVRESRERVRSALLTSGFEFPPGRITVNLAPADLPKDGGRFDLPIALGILAASGQLPQRVLAEREFYGELALSGELCETSKLLPSLVEGARTRREIILPAANAVEAAWVAGPKVRLAAHLLEVCNALRRAAPLPAARPPALAAGCGPPDLADVRGQFIAKRALEIAAAGAHGMIMIGPPGAGKTLLAQRLPGILPPLDAQEALEVASLESAAGKRPSVGSARPFRSPQHTTSVAALIGGATLRPGEISLAHSGVLFLDELPEFARNALEALREPLESGVVAISRAKSYCEFPARFQLIAAMNPCPCGYAGERSGRCRCTAEQVARYRNRISGPLLDRIDLHIELAAVPVGHLIGDESAAAEHSATVAARVADARRLQIERQGKLNAHLTPAELGRHCRLDPRSRALIEAAVTGLGLSARACHRVLKVARTCADLGAESRIRREDVAQAISLRALDRKCA
jgi:magnesium chelatase family protein